jgi:quercetin dioxygenase-like cupin family protein
LRIALARDYHRGPGVSSTLVTFRTFPGRTPVLNKSLVIAAVVAPVIVVSAVAQQGGIKRTPLQTVEFPPGFTTVTGIAEVPAGSCAGRHTHPGIEASYVMEGPMVVKIEGKPDQTFKAGDSFQIPANTVHDACGAGGSFKVLATYVVEKGKPLATPAP